MLRQQNKDLRARVVELEAELNKKAMAETRRNTKDEAQARKVSSILQSPDVATSTFPSLPHRTQPN